MLARRRISRDLRLAAWLGWMMPLAAALSSFFWARRRAAGASSKPSARARRAFLIRVLISERADLLRRRRRSFWRFRLIWLRMLAIGSGLPGPCSGLLVRPSAGRAGTKASSPGGPGGRPRLG